MTLQFSILEEDSDGSDLAAKLLAHFKRYMVLPAVEHFTTMVLWVFFHHECCNTPRADNDSAFTIDGRALRAGRDGRRRP